MNNLADIDITKILPQSAPFVMIDGVREYVPAKSLTAVKHVTANEWACVNSRGDDQVYPEVLLIEGAAQTAIVFSALEKDGGAGAAPRIALGKIDAEFHAPVRVGDTISFITANFKLMRGRGYVDVDMFRDGRHVGAVNIFYSSMTGGANDSTES